MNYALVRLLLLYSLIIWVATYSIYIQNFKSLQNQSIRPVVIAHFRDPVKPHYLQLKTLQINDLFKFEVAKFVYRTFNNKTPNSFCNYLIFTKNSDRSNRAARQTADFNNLHISRYRTNKLRRCILLTSLKLICPAFQLLTEDTIFNFC